MADTLAELLNNVNAYKQGAETATASVLKALDTQADFSLQNQRILSGSAEDSKVIQESKNASDYATQLARVKAANITGTNLKEQTEQITSLSDQAERAYKKKQDVLAEMERKDSVRFLDNPLQHMINAFSIEGDKATLEIVDSQLKTAENRLLAVNQAAQTTIATQNAIQEPLTAAAMDASARNAAVEAKIAANNAGITALNYGVKGIETALNTKKEVLALEFQSQGAKNAARGLQLQEENAAQSRIEFSYRQKEYQAREADKQAQDDMGRSVVETVNLGRKVLLQDKYTPLTDINGKMIISALKSKGTLADDMKVYYEAGERSKIEGRVIIGATPAAAAESLQKIPIQLNPTQAQIKGILAQAASDTSVGIQEAAMGGKNANPVFVGVNPKDKSSISKAFSGRAQQILNEYSRVINPADGNNPYQIASVNQLFQNSPTVRDLPVVQKVLAPIMKTGVQLSDPKQIMSIVGDAVAKGKITHKEALELTTVYHVGVKANLAMRNFEGFGLQPSNRYNAVVEINPDAFTSTAVVDMTRPDSVSRALMQIQAGRMQKEIMEGSRSITTGKKSNNIGTLFDTRGVAPDSMFQPNPGAARALEAATDTNGAIAKFFSNLPHASDFENKANGKQTFSGKIKPPTTGN